ncbi:MAG: hypothetical protein FRX48_06195 [Lasallia pustulata]|uniref:HotDog domain n=1 Tax=Lasallia pustulata TaxID=136370 RepID=A0A5M8PM55_9LECA|nr:MAG: hypothetical protein FRX48_06195 [Lasallia pustulata]
MAPPSHHLRAAEPEELAICVAYPHPLPLLRHILLSPPHLSPPTTTSAPLFAPLITTTRSPLLECDYNLHKSNSTYFSDLDVARTHLVTALCARGMGVVHRDMEREEGKGGFVKVMLGGVYCGFRREIKPYQGYEIWTRVLAWDRKWLYMVSHFVEAGAVRPGRYIMQAGNKRTERPKPASSAEERATGAKQQAHPAILASSVAKYVFKQGRRTVAPERILRASNLLPPAPPPLPRAAASRPVAATGATLSNANDNGDDAHGLEAAPPPLAAESAHSLLDSFLMPAILEGESAGGDGGGDERWTWEDVERERERGMRVAGVMGELDEGLLYQGVWELRIPELRDLHKISRICILTI